VAQQIRHLLPADGDRQSRVSPEFDPGKEATPDFEEERTMSKKARDVMTSECKCVSETDTVLDAAKRLSELDVGAMPICGEDDRLKGMLTDRDIVVKVLAQGNDPAEVKVGEFAQGKPVTIGADDSIEEALDVMAEHKVRRLPVIDGHDCVGVISQADVATDLPGEKVGDLVAAISAAP
jgi:CBS domain-containing protein